MWDVSNPNMVEIWFIVIDNYSDAKFSLLTPLPPPQATEVCLFCILGLQILLTNLDLFL